MRTSKQTAVLVAFIFVAFVVAAAALSSAPGETTAAVSTAPGGTTAAVSTAPGGTTAAVSTAPGGTTATVSTAPGETTAAVETAPEMLVGAGDISTCNTDKDEATAQLLDGIAGTVATFGDNVYPDGSTALFTDCYGPTWGRHIGRTRPSSGNHDYHIAGAAGYFEYFGAAAGSPGQGYYSYDLGGWRIVVLNSECSKVGGCDASSPQGQWLQADLAASTSPCKLAYWHKPLFSSGVHGGIVGSKPLWEALYDAGTDVILNGHDHIYERFGRQDPDGLADSTSGIRQFTVGTGGAGLTTVVAVQPNSEVRNDTDFGVLKLTLQPGRYDWEFVPVAGDDFTDTGSGSCGANVGPRVDAGTDQSVPLGDPVALDGTVTDDGLPTGGSLTTLWSVLSGPGTATIADPGAVDTTATFEIAGTYQLSLTATDGDGLTGTDTTQVVVSVAGPGGSFTWDGAVVVGSDDAEQLGSGAVRLANGELELVVKGTDVQTVGVRFTNVAIPQNATIVSAHVQFRAVSVSTGAANLVIKAQASDNAPTFATGLRNITNRPTGLQSASWSPLTWDLANEVGPDQKTTDLTTLIQEVVSRSGWAGGNAIALIFTGSGTRIADAIEGGFAPQLHVVYSTGGPPSNQPPVANAGPDQTVTLPDPATLDGAGSNDSGGPGIVSYSWQQISGPAGATLAQPDSTQTGVTFTQAGVYNFELTVTDGGGLVDTDTVRIETIDASGPFTWTGTVAAGADDAEEDASSGRVTLTNSDLDLVLDTTTNKLVGLRFTNVNIPANAVIQSAHIQFRSDEIQSGPTSLSIQGFATPNLTAFTTTKRGISTRSRTTAVTWDPVPAWTAVNQTGLTQRTPDLAGIVQAIVGASGWAPNNALGFIITGTGKRTADAYEGNYATQLIITYTVPQP